jgi:hypothetical protein
MPLQRAATVLETRLPRTMQLNNTMMDSSFPKTSHFKELTKVAFCWTCRLLMTRTTPDVLLLQRRQRRAKVLPFVGHAGCRLPEFENQCFTVADD